MKPKGALVLWKFKFCAKNHLVKVGTLNWCIKHTVYIHKGTVQCHLCLIEGVYLPLRGKQGIFSLKKFTYVSLYMAKRDIKALWSIMYNYQHGFSKKSSISSLYKKSTIFHYHYQYFKAKWQNDHIILKVLIKHF